MNKTLVVIPYCAEGAQGDEIRYAISGWHRHFKEPHEIVVIGDYPGVFDGTFINCPRISHRDDGNYLPHLDHANKFLTALSDYPDVDGFIYACDDMYAVNDFTLADVKRLKDLEDDMGGNFLSGNGWDRDVAKTRNMCIKAGVPTRNWVCHLPIWFDREKFQVMYDRFNYHKNSFVVEDVYFNLFYGDEVADRVSKYSHWRLGISEPQTKEELQKAIRERIWLTNSPTGWDETLNETLREYYG